MTDALATKTFDLTADESGEVHFEHGFGNKPDTIITNNLGDHVKENIFSPVVLGITKFDVKELWGTVYSRETGEPAPGAEISVELGAVYYG